MRRAFASVEKALRAAAATIAGGSRKGASTVGLRRADAMRLIEILVGPDAALQATRRL